MPLTITFTSDATANELAAINAMIAVLHGVPNVTPASSSASGPASPPTTSATVQDAPAGMTAEQQAVHEANVRGEEWRPDLINARTSREALGLPPLETLPLPPVPPVPVAVAVPPLPPVSSSVSPVSFVGVDLDKEGYPHDGRIHGEKHKDGALNQTAKGLWKRRRNTDDAIWDQVRAELKQAMSAPTPIELLAARLPDTPPAEPGVPPLPPVLDAATAFAPPAVPTVPPVPVAIAVAEPVIVPPPPPVPATQADGGFEALLNRILAASVAPDRTAAACASVGLTGIRDLLNRPDLVGAVEAALFPLA